MTLESKRFGQFQAEIEKKLAGKLWKSADFSVAMGVTLQSGGIEDIWVVVPSLEPFTPEEILPDEDFSITTRSRYAQVGINVPHSAGERMFKTRRKVDGNLIVRVPVLNNAARPVSLPQGTRLFRLFLTPSGANIKRESLLEMIEKGEIAVSGERGRDWEVLFGKEPGTLWLKLDPGKIFWVPPHPDGDPITIPDDPGMDYRSLVDFFLKPAPISQTSIHWVGETVSRLGLNPLVSAVIDRIPLGRGVVPAHESEHVNSLLLDGESPEWPIRTEILSPTSLGKIPEYILLSFLKDKRETPD